jgi:hypothetical protein
MVASAPIPCALTFAKEMKFLIFYLFGITSGIVLSALGYYAVSEINKPDASLAYEIRSIPDKSGRSGAFDVYRDEEKLFNYYVYGNGFSWSVPASDHSLNFIHFGKSENSEPESPHYIFRVTKIKADKNIEITSFDLEKSMIESIQIFDIQDKILYNEDGTPVAN